MRRYELTDHGKFLIAVMLIILLLIILALTLIAWALSRNTTPDNSLHNPDAIHQNDTSPTPSEPVLETDPDEAQALQNGNNSDPEEPSLIEPTALDIDAGTMRFLYTPDLYPILDEDTITMIGQLLTSPKNTADSILAVEIPQLPDSDAAKLTTAIIEAFTTLEIPLSDVVFFAYQTESDAEAFEIRISLS